MSWFCDEKTSWLQSLCIKILKSGSIPCHVAVIMDGNRRYAEKINLNKLQGLKFGFKKLSQTLSWCTDLGISELTAYAFSIENFKRTQVEVDGIMEFAREKFRELLIEKKKIMDRGWNIKFLGDLSLLPEDIRCLMAEVVDLTKNNKKLILNLCFAYTSREEISTAIREMAIGVEKGLLKPSDINESLLDSCLYSSHSQPPELLIRTSGEVRLSDFLLWQASYSVLTFVKTLWPQFSFWHLIAAGFEHQRQIKFLRSIKERSDSDRAKREKFFDYENAVEEIMRNKQFIKNEDYSVGNLVMKWRVSREERVRLFLSQLREKRDRMMADILRKNKTC